MIKKVLFYLILFLLITFYIINYYFLYDFNKYQNLNRILSSNSFTNKVFNEYLSFFDEIDLIKYFYHLTNRNKSYLDLEFSSKDFRFFEKQKKNFLELNYIDDKINTWRKAHLYSNGDKFKIKVKAQGTSVSSLKQYDQFSYRLKYDSNSFYKDGFREFNLKTFYDENDLSTLTLNSIAKELGLISSPGETRLLKINGIKQGLFYLEEHLSEQFLEKNKITNYSIIKPVDDWNFRTSGHQTVYDLTKYYKEISGNSDHNELALNALNELFYAFENQDIEKVKFFFDEDYISKFIGYLNFTNNYHQIAGDNIRYIYNFDNGKFYFRFRIEDSIIPFSDNINSFENSLIDNFNEYNYNDYSNNKLLLFLLKDKKIFEKRNLFLKELVDKKQIISNRINKVYQENFVNLINSNQSYIKSKHDYSNFKINTMHNLDIIERYLNYSKINIVYDINKNFINFSLINDSFNEINLKKIKIIDNQGNEKIIDDNNILPSLPPLRFNNNSLPTKISLKLKNENYSDNIKFVFVNTLTNKEIDQNNININKIDTKVFFKTINQTITQLNKNKIKFNIDGNEIHILSGNYIVSNNIIFPKGYNVTIEPGTVLRLFDNVSILIQGGLKAVGKKDKFINIVNFNKNNNFGTFAVNSHKKKVILKNFNISGGSSDIINGIKFLGQLALHDADVLLDKIIVSNSVSDDGMNIKNSKVAIYNSFFINNLYDQIDLDFCFGILEGNIFKFKSISNTKSEEIIYNGDGLDLSGSAIKISDNTFSNFQDKAISVGEKTKALVTDNFFLKNKIAIEIKDESKVYVNKNKFENNKLDFNLYIKKFFFGDPQLFSIDNLYSKIINIVNGEIIYLSDNNFTKDSQFYL